MTAETGFCRNARCVNGKSGEAIEWYAGAGEYCPQCGDELEPRPPAALAGTEEYRDTAARLAAALAPQSSEARPAPRIVPLAIVGAFVAVVLAVVGVLVFGKGSNPSEQVTGGVNVCSSTASAHLARDLVAAFAAKTATAPLPLHVAPAANQACEVRFWSDAAGPKDAVVAHDGLVVIVHPQNPVSKLDEKQLRDIYSGRVTTWSDLGGHGGPITPIAPPDDGDGGKQLATTLFRGIQLGHGVVRGATDAEITRRVASASGQGTLGIVQFSEAIPARVVALDSGPAPSAISIGSHRYALSLDIMVASDLRSPPAAAVAMIAFARSKDGQAVVARDGLVPKEGS